MDTPRRSKDSYLVTATFRDRESANRAYEAVTNRRGYTEDDVSVLMSEETKKRHYSRGDSDAVERGNKAAEGAGIGAAVGGSAGGIAGAVLAAGGTLLIPGLGLAIAGPLAAILAGAGAGGAGGTLIGALIGAGIPEERAKHYKEDLQEGHIVLGVEPHSIEDARYIENTWRDHGGERIHAGYPETEHR